MALTGLQIFKLLPNTNCGDCGVPTCLAFAMKLAAKRVELSKCPHASDEAKAALGEASAPPIRKIAIGAGENMATVGEELVMFRHDKTFYHKTVIAPLLHDNNNAVDEAKTLSSIVVERAGEVLKIDAIALQQSGDDGEHFAKTAQAISSETGLPLILISGDPDGMKKALDLVGDKRPLVYPMVNENFDGMTAIAKEKGVPIVVAGPSGLDGLIERVKKVKAAGVEDIVLDPSSKSLAGSLRDQTLIRRAALQADIKDLGYPTISGALSGGDSSCKSSIASIAAICKYSSFLVIEDFQPWQFLPLLTLRQNIYTDPQKPLQVEPKIYPILEPDESSPLLVTTNFSLTYFMVSTEIDDSEVPSHLLITEAEGQSVLTAWAAGKFSPEIIAKAVMESKIEERLKHRNLIIPGYVAMLSGELEENLPGWRVHVGPQESADIPAYLREEWPQIASSPAGDA
ncbi:MAG: acetyl-CoA decarbonylase/synthase complex subunit gamma [Candidatus Tritonobacter lacicola]|nr:acetyl-CoA decarbonylase/synthase complex subunit gamma [Candidatus Tritonobacter lacicola]